MSENKEATSSIPLKSLYGIGEDGSLFIIEPEGEFDIFRLMDSVDLDIEEVENSTVKGIENLELIVNGSVKAVYSLSDFGSFVDEAINIMLEDDIEDLKEIRESILKRLHNDKELEDDWATKTI